MTSVGYPTSLGRRSRCIKYIWQDASGRKVHTGTLLTKNRVESQTIENASDRFVARREKPRCLNERQSSTFTEMRGATASSLFPSYNLFSHMPQVMQKAGEQFSKEGSAVQQRNRR